jgi:MFS family permease
MWYLALNTPTTLYGIAGGIILSTYGIGGLVTHIITRKRHVVAAVTLTLLATIALMTTHQLWAIIAAQFIVGFMSYTLILVLTAQMQDFLPSRFRAGAGSTVNTTGRLIKKGI